MLHAHKVQLFGSPIALRAAVMLIALAWSSLAFCGEIHDAVRKGDLATVQALLKDNPDLALSRDKGGRTALQWAAILGFKEISQVLLDYKADINARDSGGMTPLHFALLQGHKDELQLLLDNKADVNAGDITGATPLQYAVGYNVKDFVELLLSYKANVNSRDKAGRTPLYVAKAGGYKDIEELLRQHGGHE
jgi:ankyrin repeat protein